jgi:gluconate 2-dehydrogenase gamma chain
MDRRELLTWMVATGGLTALNRLSASDLVALGRDAHATPARDAAGHSHGVVLDARAAAIVTAAAERIIPATDTPGATEAGVTAFVETMLSGWYAPADRDRLLDGLRELDLRAQSLYTRTFAGCNPAQQTALLATYDDVVSAMRAAQDTNANAHWFAILKYLTVWGYCTSEAGMRQMLGTWPLPMRYDGNATVTR